jgi:hypothetical protein
MQLRTDIFGSARARRNCAFPEGERFLTYEETIQGIPTALWEEQRRHEPPAIWFESRCHVDLLQHMKAIMA